jgi:hypothetical protein
VTNEGYDPTHPSGEGGHSNQSSLPTGSLPTYVEAKARAQGTVGSPVGKIAGAIAAVMSEVGVVDKGGTLTFGQTSYKYARMEDLLRVITPLMGKHGLAVIQNEVGRGMQGANLAMTYEFSIIHSSGESWPERPRFTGLAAARDDKAINKAHTAARKYFLLSLFQVPTGDLDDADEDAPKQHTPVPGPVPGPSRVRFTTGTEVGRQAQQPAPPPMSVEERDGLPHKIVLGTGTGVDQWANAYIRAIGKAKSPDELQDWDRLNASTLDIINDRYSAVYDMINTAATRRFEDFNPAPSVDQETGEVLDDTPDKRVLPEMPDPKVDATVALNWVAQNLSDFINFRSAEEFWNEVVIPRDREFERNDWAVLNLEWQRTKARLAGS